MEIIYSARSRHHCRFRNIETHYYTIRHGSKRRKRCHSWAMKKLISIHNITNRIVVNRRRRHHRHILKGILWPTINKGKWILCQKVVHRSSEPIKSRWSQRTIIGGIIMPIATGVIYISALRLHHHCEYWLNEKLFFFLVIVGMNNWWTRSLTCFRPS